MRQLAARARRRVAQRKPRFQTTLEQRDALAQKFFGAVERGDLAGLEEMLASDVELSGDGGGKAPVLSRPLRGRDRVARALGGWIRLAKSVPSVSVRAVEVNGAPGGLFVDMQKRLISVMALEIVDLQITSISVVANPDKLVRIGPVAEPGSLFGLRVPASVGG